MWYVTAFYKFFNLNNVEEAKANLEKLALDYNIYGLVILGSEGINSTCATQKKEDLETLKRHICNLTNDQNLFFKDSQSEVSPFRRFKAKIRSEIVTLGTPHLVPDQSNHHLSPAEWNEVLKNEKDFALIDTRNWYETEIGTFKGAINPKTEMFTEFPDFFEKQNIPKDKKTLIFCTGGIRCEKGILELQEKGFHNVYQLEGGILNYLKEYPNSEFEGECFVFDHRVALDQNLQPTKKYKLCPHCGQPGQTEITCDRCSSEAVVCQNCHPISFKGNTCSKHCSYQLEKYPERKGTKQELSYHARKT
jgi:UPF0176 protein